MKTLYNFLVENENVKVDEGLLKAGLSLSTLNSMDPDDLLTGILSMYDYIVDEDDIELFYDQYPIKEQPLWRNLYEMYSKKMFSIIDVKVDNDFFNEKPTNSDDEDETTNVPAGRNDVESLLDECFPVFNQLIKVTPEFRRYLRKFINDSRNKTLELKPSEPEYIMAVEDEVNNTVLIFTVNRVPGIFRRLFNTANRKWLEKVLTKLGE